MTQGGIVEAMTSDHADYFAMLQRMIAAAGRRLADADPADLPLLAMLRADLDRALRSAVAGQRDRGFSWTEIGRGLGTTRQNALARFGRGAA